MIDRDENETLDHEEHFRIFDEMTRSSPVVGIPEWDTPESTSAWVRAMRQESDARIERAWADRSGSRDQLAEGKPSVAVETVRTHVLLPRDVVERVDRLVGQRRRSHYLSEALREKLDRDELIRLAEEAAGSLADVNVPGWETPESTDAWVRSLREGTRFDPASAADSDE